MTKQRNAQYDILAIYEKCKIKIKESCLEGSSGRSPTGSITAPGQTLSNRLAGMEERCSTETEVSDTRILSIISHLLLLRASRHLGGSHGDQQGLNLLVVGLKTNKLLAL